MSEQPLPPDLDPDIRPPGASHDGQISPPVSPTTSAPTTPFDFDRMTESFESVQKDFLDKPRPLPSADRFSAAMQEVVKLFELLGSAFAFVKRDIDSKIAIIDEYAERDPRNFAHLHDAVCFEMKNDTARQAPTMPRSCSRTILRLMWALKFAGLLLDGLFLAFDPASSLPPTSRTLKWAVARAYGEALAEHHSWTMRKAVRSACMLLPTKESFIARIGIDHDGRDESLRRLSSSMSPLVTRMYAFYETNELLDLP